MSDVEQSVTRRGIETFYTLYFVALIPITLLIDLQSFYPPAVVPQYLKDVNTFYLSTSGDPLVSRTLGGPAQMAWFDPFSYLEAGFQLPIFFLAIYGLVQSTSRVLVEYPAQPFILYVFAQLPGYTSVYILTLIYSVHTATTVMPCLVTFLAIPTAIPDAPTGSLTLTANQKQFLVTNYAPFLLITVGMAADSAFKLWSIVRESDYMGSF
ncbi:hypothetical protein FRB98_009528 [Tulasnella sp. 332]|nr:hypothetical protein FRB98_009528 [Tulasnella sp. 332]